MGFKIAIIYYSLYGRLVTLANVIAEGARKVRFDACVSQVGAGDIIVQLKPTPCHAEHCL